MNETSLESKLNSEELNKILPSYLIDEVDENKSDKNEKKENILEESNNVSLIFIYK